MGRKKNYQEPKDGTAIKEETSIEKQETIVEQTLKEAGEETEDGSEATVQEEINEADGEPIYHANEGEE